MNAINANDPLLILKLPSYSRAGGEREPRLLADIVQDGKGQHSFFMNKPCVAEIGEHVFRVCVFNKSLLLPEIPKHI